MALVDDTEFTRISLELICGFRLTVGDEQVPVPDAAQRLLALLALKGQGLSRSLIAGTLWPEKTEYRATANLRSCIWRLHRASPGQAAIACTGTSLFLNPRIELDVAALERQGWALLDGRIAAMSEHSTDWFSQELLPGWYEDWVIIERERLMQLQIRFLEGVVHTFGEAGDLARAIDHAMRLVAMDPLRERSQLALIRALLAEGSWGQANRVAANYCRLLDEAFGRRASEGFAAAYRSLNPLHTSVIAR